MAKGGSGLAALAWKARRSVLNSAAPRPGPQVAQERVLGIQRKLHRWAEDDQDRRFTDLHNLVCDPATLLVAWQRVRANRGSRSAGVDTRRASTRHGAHLRTNPDPRDNRRHRPRTDALLDRYGATSVVPSRSVVGADKMPALPTGAGASVTSGNCPFRTCTPTVVVLGGDSLDRARCSRARV